MTPVGGKICRTKRLRKKRRAAYLKRDGFTCAQMDRIIRGLDPGDGAIVEVTVWRRPIAS